jgi:hypothetical protein
VGIELRCAFRQRRLRQSEAAGDGAKIPHLIAISVLKMRSKTHHQQRNLNFCLFQIILDTANTNKTVNNNSQNNIFMCLALFIHTKIYLQVYFTETNIILAVCLLCLLACEKL